jgi:hypothetical protein
MPVYVIGPSHIHSDFTHQIQEEINSKTLFNDCILDAYRGLPIWSNHIVRKLEENKENKLVWIVSDYKFNNFDYDKLLGTKELFLDSIGYPGNVDPNFMKPHHIELLGKHSLDVIDYIVKNFPHIKLVFWCLYKRTKVNTNSSYPQYLWYDSIKIRYSNNIIDIDEFTNEEEFSKGILDEGGHPNKEGFYLLNDMIMSVI